VNGQYRNNFLQPAASDQNITSGGSLVWLIGVVVCLLVANRGSNCSLTGAIDDCGIINACKSALSLFHVRSAIANAGLYFLTNVRVCCPVFMAYNISACSHDLQYFATRSVLWRLECAKFVYRPGYAPDPVGGAHDAPPEPVIGWRNTSPLSPRLDAYSASFSAPAVPHLQLHNCGPQRDWVTPHQLIITLVYKISLCRRLCQIPLYVKQADKSVTCCPLDLCYIIGLRPRFSALREATAWSLFTYENSIVSVLKCITLYK